MYSRGSFDDNLYGDMSLQSYECVDHDFPWCGVSAGGRIAVAAIFQYGRDQHAFWPIRPLDCTFSYENGTSLLYSIKNTFFR